LGSIWLTAKRKYPAAKRIFRLTAAYSYPDQAFVRCRKFAKRGGAREREKGKERKKEKRKKRGKGEKRVISLKLIVFYVYLFIGIYRNIDRKESTDLVVI
jgi:hypothetical protein